METKDIARPSFFHAATTLSNLCERIDRGEEIDNLLMQEFSSAKISLAESIDRRKFVHREALAKIELAREYKRSIDKAIDHLKKVAERIERNTMEMMEAQPGLPYRDTLGQKLTICKNSQGSLKISFDHSNLEEESIEFLGIDPKYIDKTTLITLNTEKVKQDLASGIELPWATLTHGKHIRGLK